MEIRKKTYTKWPKQSQSCKLVMRQPHAVLLYISWKSNLIWLHTDWQTKLPSEIFSTEWPLPALKSLPSISTALLFSHFLSSLIQSQYGTNSTASYTSNTSECPWRHCLPGDGIAPLWSFGCLLWIRQRLGRTPDAVKAQRERLAWEG